MRGWYVRCLATRKSASTYLLGLARAAAGPPALPGLPEEADLSLALRALADSLLSLRAVEEVRYLVDGEFASAYGGAAVLEPYLSAA